MNYGGQGCQSLVENLPSIWKTWDLAPVLQMKHSKVHRIVNLSVGYNHNVIKIHWDNHNTINLVGILFSWKCS